MLRLSPRGVRSLVVLVIASSVLSLGPPAHAGGVQWRPRLGNAIDYARGRAGSVSFAVIGTDGVLRGYRADTAVPAASVLKVMFMVAYLRRPERRHRELRRSERDLLRPMIRRSDNAAATQIANMLGPGPMYRLADRAGMRDFSYTRPWGLSRTSARDQARFMYKLRSHIPRLHQRYAFRLLSRIVASQRWGIGQVDTTGWRKHFKGGWGSGSGAVDHQVVQLRRPSRRHVSLAVMTTSSPDHEYGKQTLRGVFRRLLANLPSG